MEYFRYLTLFVILALCVLLTDLFLETRSPNRPHIAQPQEALMLLD